MAFIGDTTKTKLQLKLTNFAESLPEMKTKLHVCRISFILTILDDDDEQLIDERRPLSSYRHLSFRSAMLTRHAGAGDGQPERRFQNYGHGGLDGLIHPLHNQHRGSRPFLGVRKRGNRWVAEVRPKGERSRKVHLGSYQTLEAAARGVDVGKHYYRDSDRLNFPDSLQYLVPVPLGLMAEGKKEFVVQEAHRLASLTEKLQQPFSS